jgi:hypothetical protein
MVFCVVISITSLIDLKKKSNDKYIFINFNKYYAVFSADKISIYNIKNF